VPQQSTTTRAYDRTALTSSAGTLDSLLSSQATPPMRGNLRRDSGDVTLDRDAQARAQTRAPSFGGAI